MTNRCGACGKFCGNIDGVRCTKCNVVMHKQCINLSPNSVSNGKYVCKACKHKLKKPNDDIAISSQDLQAPDSDSIQETGTSSPLGQDIKLLRVEISNFRSELAGIFSVISEIGKRLDCIEERVNKLEENPIDLQSPPAISSEIMDTVDQLQKRLNDAEQQQLLNDVCISGVPEENGENLTHIVMSLANKLSFDLDERDIVSAHRMGRQQSRQESNTDGAVSPARPRTIAVRLTRRRVRDEFLRAARVRRGADTAGTGIGGAARRFYVNEHLSKYHSRLFHLARERAAAESWRYVWSKEGRIFVRRDPKASSHRIRCEEDISKIFRRG
ncbi:unnamed protein product [Colias eurytheme]|nr:unnamed protein product [Colias eurytheme]